MTVTAGWNTFYGEAYGWLLSDEVIISSVVHSLGVKVPGFPGVFFMSTPMSWDIAVRILFTSAMLLSASGFSAWTMSAVVL